MGLLLLMGDSQRRLLDTLSAARAYSIRRLRTASSLCLRVRRASDSAESDIGWSGNDIDVAAITAFCSGTNGFVVTWYDQSGNGINATNATSTEQPKIFDSATGIQKGGILTGPLFDSASFQKLAFSTVNLQSAFSVFKINTLISANYICGSTTAGIAAGGLVAGFDGISAFDNVNARTLSGESTNPKIGSWVKSGSNIFLGDNAGALTDSGTIGNLTVTHIGGRPLAFPTYIEGVISEVIIFTTDQTANRSVIIANQNAYFGVY